MLDNIKQPLIADDESASLEKSFEILSACDREKSDVVSYRLN